jgi:hypothetical protein
VLEPVAEQEGVVLGEAAVVEHQQELAAVGLEPLDRMRAALGEVPDVADADVVDELAALLVDRGDAGAAVYHVGPFGGLVPMQLAHAAGVEPHVDAGDLLGDAELALGDLAGPAAALEPHVRRRERKFQVRHRSVIGRRGHEDVGVLQLKRNVARPRIGAAPPRPHRLRRAPLP